MNPSWPILLTVTLAAAVHAGGQFLPPESFISKTLDTNRTIRIWLPPSYDSRVEDRYPVLYLHDGQSMLSSAGPQVAFGWGNWEVDLTVERLAAAKRMREIILVAIDNTPQRYQEYRGRATIDTEEEKRASRRPLIDAGDNSAYERYARFLIEELKPAIDRRFRTLADPRQTGVLGSSMGGICSVVLAWDYPEVFGLAASLSGSYQIEKRHFLQKVLLPCVGSPKAVRLYLDCGVTAGVNSDDGRINTEAVVSELRRIGWKDDATLKYFLDEHPLTPEQLTPLGLAKNKFQEAQISQHNELYWRRRVWRALVFLFPPE